MGKICIVTDSSVQFIDPAVVRRYGIVIVPQTIVIGGRAYLEGQSIDSAGMGRIAAETRATPQHQAISVEQFQTVYGALRKETDTILSIHLSRTISKTFDHAQEATKATLGRLNVTLIDSMSCALGLGAIVEMAARMAEAGEPIDQISRVIRRRTQNLYALFYTEAFEALRQNGLLSDSHAALGAMLGIKPFVTIEDGELIAIEKVRTRQQVIDKLIEFAAEFEASDRLYILHGSNTAELTRQLTERLRDELHRQNSPTVHYGPTLATFIGMDALGVMIFQASDTTEL